MKLLYHRRNAVGSGRDVASASGGVGLQRESLHRVHDARSVERVHASVAEQEEGREPADVLVEAVHGDGVLGAVEPGDDHATAEALGELRPVGLERLAVAAPGGVELDEPHAGGLA